MMKSLTWRANQFLIQRWVKKTLFTCLSPADAIYFDVDQTLVIWPRFFWEPGEGTIQISTYHLKPHRAHIEALKAYADDGKTIIVWSHGGGAWAHQVVVALGLEGFVHSCLPKPTIYYDDLKCDEFMTIHRYIAPGES